MEAVGLITELLQLCDCIYFNIIRKSTLNARMKKWWRILFYQSFLIIKNDVKSFNKIDLV